MNLYKVSFFPLYDRGDENPVGRAMVYVTSHSAIRIREVIDRSAMSDKDGSLPTEFNGIPVTLENEILVPVGMSAYSVTIGIPPGGVSFCIFAENKKSLHREVMREMVKCGNFELANLAEHGALISRHIKLEMEGVW